MPLPSLSQTPIRAVSDRFEFPFDRRTPQLLPSSSRARTPAYAPYAEAEHNVTLLMTLNRRIHYAYNQVREDNPSMEGVLDYDFHGVPLRNRPEIVSVP